MSNLRTSLLLACIMALAAAAGIAAKPRAKAADVGRGIVLEEIVPRKFGDWTEQPQVGAYVVNPQTKELLDKLYSQLLNRTYVNSSGYRIMLALAYGDDQRGALQAHMPEVCYPAQGFTLHSNEEVKVATPFGAVPGRRLSTSLGRRKEPVTYWFTMGDTTVRNKLQRRMVEFKVGLTGQVPDGLLFRVSSIDESPEKAFELQQGFVADLLQAVTQEGRLRLSGLGSPG